MEEEDWHKAHSRLASCLVPPQVRESEASAPAASSESSSGAAAWHQQRVRRWWSHEQGRSEPRRQGQMLRLIVEYYFLGEKEKKTKTRSLTVST